MTPVLYTVLFYYLWVAPHVLLGSVLFFMVRRQVYRQFPMFFLYAMWEISQFAVLFAIHLSNFHFGPGYKGAYLAGLALSTAIRFAVIHELFRHFFHRYPALTGPGRFLFRGATVLLLLIAVGLAISAPGNPADQTLARAATFSSLRATTFALDRAVTILQCGLLISLFLFSRYFTLSWRSNAFGIALGLGVFASLELATSAIRIYVTSMDKVFDISSMVTYHLCVLIWMFYLLAPEREPRYALQTLPEHDLEIWNQELQRLLQQ